MNWEQVQEMAKDPLVTIGAHTLGHHNFKCLTDDEIRAEVEGSRKIIADKLGRPVKHFAYPFGGPAAIGQREADLVKEMGFATVVTTRQANVMPAHRGTPNLLPRITLSGNYQTLSRVERQRCGMISALQNRFRRTLTL